MVSSVYFGLVFGVLRHLQIVQGHGAVLVQILGALQLSAGENLIRDGLPVIRIAARNIVAANGQQQLAFLHGVAEPRVNGHDAAGSERDDRDVAGDVGRDCARDDQLGGGGMLGRRGQRELLRMVHREEAASAAGTTLAGGGASAAASPCAVTAAENQQHSDGDQKSNEF